MTIERCEEDILALTHAQAKKGTYPNLEEEKRRLQQAKAELEKEMVAEKMQKNDTGGTSRRNEAKQNIIR